MAITTYSELQSAIADWLNRSDLTSVITSFISLGEAQYHASPSLDDYSQPGND